MLVKKIVIIAGALILLGLMKAAFGTHRHAAHPMRVDAPKEMPVRAEPVAKRDDPKKESEPSTLKGHTGEVMSVCFSPHGKRIG